jgi:hypothetical protein
LGESYESTHTTKKLKIISGPPPASKREAELTTSNNTT